MCIIVSPLGLKWIPVSHTGGYENEREAPSAGPLPIINIKKEKRETEEETKEILRSLERDNVSPHGCQSVSWSRFLFRIVCEHNFPVAFLQFIDDPFLRSEQKSCPVQLPLAVSGWGFKEEFSTPAIKIEKVEDDGEPMEATVEGNCRMLFVNKCCFWCLLTLSYLI